MTDWINHHSVERFADRSEAGSQLADRLESMISGEDCVVLALPRGGVPVAYEVATRLGAPLDILLVRKLGVPWQPELAFGAIATGDVVVLNDDHVQALGLGDDLISDIIDRERMELERREGLYRDDHGPVDVTGKTVVVVDDGIATGSTVRAALECLAERGAARRIVACPVAAAETVSGLEDQADEVVCLRTPVQFAAVGAWYDDFAPVSDAEVKQLLTQSAAEVAEPID
ncbi:MAG TPA: phosphoribosyltransferase family protein [Longimicrobiales bacterium]|nr:phosphoribosyltransferase family protein [Longimicrobiales bacterium]